MPLQIASCLPACRPEGTSAAPFQASMGVGVFLARTVLRGLMLLGTRLLCGVRMPLM